MYIKPSERYPDNWPRLRRWVFQRDRYICQHCGRKTSHPQCHHIRPIGRGGSHHPNNLTTLCEYCHKRIYMSYKR